jgi:hypothetical protein
MIANPRTRTLQPTTLARLNRANSLTHSIFAAYNFCSPTQYPGTGQKFVDASGLTGVLTASGTFAVARSNRNYAINLLDDGASVLAAPTALPPGPWSYLVVFVMRAFTGTESIVTVSEEPGSGVMDRSIFVGNAGAFPQVQACLFDSDFRFAEGATELAAGRTYVAIATCDGATLRVYLDGREDGSVAVSNFGYTGYSTPEFLFGLANQIGGIAAGSNVDLSAFVAARTCWSAREAFQLSRNPWAIYAPRTDAFSFVPAGGGIEEGDGAAAGAGVATGVGAKVGASVATAAGVAVASGVGAATAQTVGASAGVGAASGVGAPVAQSAGSAAGGASAAAVGAATAATVGSAAGAADAAGVSGATAAVIGAAAGVGTASGVGTGTAQGVGAAAGVGAASGVGLSTRQAGGSAAGAAVAAGVGAGTAQGVGAAAGMGTAAGVGAAAAQADGAAAGVAAVAGVGTATAQTTGSAAGAAAVAGVGEGIAQGEGEGVAAGTSAVSGVGGSIAGTVGSAAGAATVAGVGGTLVEDGDGAAAATATCNGVGARIVSAVGAASGSSTVAGVGADANAVPPPITEGGGHFVVRGVSLPIDRARRRRRVVAAEGVARGSSIATGYGAAIIRRDLPDMGSAAILDADAELAEFMELLQLIAIADDVVA